MKIKLDTIINGDAKTVLKKLPAGFADCIVTSPLYFLLRDYGIPGQIGQEATLELYIKHLCDVFSEARRVLKNSGTCWVVIGDTYGTGSGSGIRSGKQATNRGTQKNKNWQDAGRPEIKGFNKSLLQIPARFAIEMINRGWTLRNEIIWKKPNTMTSSATDRFTVDFEKVFFFTKSDKYYFKQQLEPASDASEMDYRRVLRRKNAEVYNLKQPYKKNFPKKFRTDGMRNKRCVWDIPIKGNPEAHFATYPEQLLETPIEAGCPQGGIVLDFFMGNGTTGKVAKQRLRNFLGVEINKEYIAPAMRRIGTFLF